MPAKRKKRRNTPQIIKRILRIIRLEEKIRARVKEIGLLGIKKKRSMTKISQKTVAVMADLTRLSQLQSHLAVELIEDVETATDSLKTRSAHIKFLAHIVNRTLKILCEDIPDWKGERDVLVRRGEEFELYRIHIKDQIKGFCGSYPLHLEVTDRAIEVFARAVVERL